MAASQDRNPGVLANTLLVQIGLLQLFSRSYLPGPCRLLRDNYRRQGLKCRENKSPKEGTQLGQQLRPGSSVLDKGSCCCSQRPGWVLGILPTPSQSPHATAAWGCSRLCAAFTPAVQAGRGQGPVLRVSNRESVHPGLAQLGELGVGGWGWGRALPSTMPHSTGTAAAFAWIVKPQVSQHRALLA